MKRKIIFTTVSVLIAALGLCSFQYLNEHPDAKTICLYPKVQTEPGLTLEKLANQQSVCYSDPEIISAVNSARRPTGMVFSHGTMCGTMTDSKGKVHLLAVGWVNGVISDITEQKTYVISDKSKKEKFYNDAFHDAIQQVNR